MKLVECQTSKEYIQGNFLVSSVWNHGARQEMVQVQNLCQDNTNFAKELMATYHAILHTDFRSEMLILYYKDIRNLMGVQILANKVDGRDGKRGENVIYKMRTDIIASR